MIAIVAPTLAAARAYRAEHGLKGARIFATPGSMHGLRITANDEMHIIEPGGKPLRARMYHAIVASTQGIKQEVTIIKDLKGRQNV